MTFKLKVAATSKHNLHKVRPGFLLFTYFVEEFMQNTFLRGILFVLSLCHQNPIFSQVSLLWFGNRIEMWSTLLFCINSYITVAYQCCQLLAKSKVNSKKQLSVTLLSCTFQVSLPYPTSSWSPYGGNVSSHQSIEGLWLSFRLWPSHVL